jgi:peptidoglycan hydrolase-like protein with peptidoglycan-binding domain
MTTITQNGVFPPGSLAKTQLFYPGTDNGRMIRADIQPNADAMALAFALHFKRPLYATDGARTLEEQYRLAREKPHLAAPPGTSNHGWARAFDLSSGVATRGSAEHRWILANEGRFGFEAPAWANDPGHPLYKNEAWHHEYVGGGLESPRILPAAKGEMGLGWTGALVKEYQEKLNDKGDIDIVEDGDYGFMTAVAVAAIQKRAGIPMTGRMTPATKRYLNGVAPKPPAPRKRPPARLPVVGKGSVSGWVFLIQRLVGAGVDGVYLNETVAKVKVFQDRHDLPLTGTVDLRTWVQFLYGHSLEKGDKGDRVKILQNMVGLTGRDADGVFQTKTHDRVVEVQRYLGLEPDGIAGRHFRTGYLRHFQ